MHKLRTKDQNKKGGQLKGWYFSLVGVKSHAIRRTRTKLKLCQIPN
jgi:hypothetical protein